jgi:hypothetical protein
MKSDERSIMMGSFLSGGRSLHQGGEAGSAEALELRCARWARQYWAFGRDASRRFAVTPLVFVFRQNPRRGSSRIGGLLRSPLGRERRVERQLQRIDRGFCHWGRHCSQQTAQRCGTLASRQFDKNATLLDVKCLWVWVFIGASTTLGGF